MASVSNQALKGVLWFFVAQSAQSLVRFGVTVVLARLLLPEDFGLVAMLAIFTQLAQAFVVSGFGGALVQKPEVTDIDYNTLFYFNLFAALVCGGLLLLLAPTIAGFYGQLLLAEILLVAPLGLLLQAALLVQGIQFQRRLDFRTPVLVGFAGLIISAIVGVSMALLGYGVWSLVFAALSRQFVTAALFWFVSDWRPSLLFSRASLLEITGFGGPILGVTLLRRLTENLPSLLIGKVYSAATLGFYNRGLAIREIASQSATAPLGRVLFPSFSRIQQDSVRMASVYIRTLSVVAFALFPVLFCLSLLAEPLVFLVYDERWAASIPYLKWLALMGAWIPLNMVNSSVIKSLGHTKVFFKLSIVGQLATVVALALSFRFGIVPIILAVGAAQFFALCINDLYLGKTLPLHLSDFVKALLPPILISGGLYLACLPILGSLSTNLLQILILAPVFALLYTVLAFLFKVHALNDLLTITQPYWIRWALLDRMLQKFRKA